MDIGEQIPEAIKRFASELPKFPDGRIDYTNATTAAVISIFVLWQGKVLLVKRSDKVLSYKGKWNNIGGYLDEVKPLRDQAYQELREELGVLPTMVKSLYFFPPRTVTDTSIGKTWISHPTLAELRDLPEIQLDWEHTEYAWVKPEEMKNFDLVTGIDRLLERLLAEK